VGCLSGLLECVFVHIHADNARESAVVECDKIGFGGLAIGEGELNTYVALSQIG
jgi:hypothetical protein